MGAKPRFSTIVLTVLGLALAMPAAAQFSDSYSFLQAVKERNGDKVMPFLNKPGQPVLNTRDLNTGETAVHMVVKRHDDTWLQFLLSRGAQTEIKDRNGDTPLLMAAQTGDVQSVTTLLTYGANVNAINSNGETALVIAVHRRDTSLAHVLINNGGDPAIRDTIAGKSASDYAAEDPRGGSAMTRILADAKPKTTPNKKIAGPTLH